MRTGEDILEIRALVLREIRDFFDSQGYIEVFTSPLLKHPNLDPNIGVFKVENHPLYLHTSPEYPMKKLLALQRRSIYQLAPVFRDEAEDPRHRKSFLMLEWYGVNHTYLRLMEEAEGLITHLAEVCGQGNTVNRLDTTIDLTPPWPRIKVAEAFMKWAGVEIDGLRNESGQRAVFEEKGLSFYPGDPWETRFNMLFVHCVEPRIRELGKPVFLYDYPVEVGLMAASHPENPTLVQRVELFAGDLELMNGYTELTDPAEQLRRWKEQQSIPIEGDLGGEPGMVEKGDVGVDRELLDALPHLGLVAGAALGVERLLMLLLDAEDISQVSLSE